MRQGMIEEFDEWLKRHEDEMFEDIAGLVAIPTVVEEGEGGYPYGTALKEAICQMGRLAEKYGFSWRNHDWHCMSISYGEGERQLGIWGHLDVVAVGEGWNYEPFVCRRVKNYLIGRGTQDNKGPDVGSLYILRYLKEHDIKPGFEVRLIYGCQEESGMKDAVEYLKREKAPDYSFVPDCAFPVCYGEKGFLKIVLKSRPLSPAVTALSGGQAANAIPSEGMAVIEEKVYKEQGIGGHSAYPDGLVNALGGLGKTLMAQTNLPKRDREAFRFLAEAGEDGYGKRLGIARSDAESGAMTCAPTLLALEEGCMKVTVNIRYPITLEGEDIAGSLKEKAEEYGLIVESVDDSKPNHEDPKGVWAQYLTQTFAEVMGERQEPYVMSGGTYARKIPNAVGFGPGLPKDLTVLNLPEGHGECHQPDESQCIDTLFQAWKIYMYTVLKLIETGLPGEEKRDELNGGNNE